MARWTKQKIEKFRTSQIGNKHNLGKKLSDETKLKISISHKGKRSKNKSLSKMGNRNPNWKGGISPENKRLRMSARFREWRESVFKRDNFTCQICFERGGELHPDHIKQFAYFPELRFQINNGRTLCKSCHMKTPTWGFKRQTAYRAEIRK